MSDDINYLMSELARLKSLVEKLATQELGPMYGWIGGAWQKQPLDGYSGFISDYFSNLSLAAGASWQTGATVPAGEYWRITHFCFTFIGTPPTAIDVYVYDGANNRQLCGQLAPVSGRTYDWMLDTPVPPGGCLKCYVTGATLNDDLYFTATGYRVDIDQ